MDNNWATTLLRSLESAYEGIHHLENRINHGELSLTDVTLLDTVADLINAMVGAIAEDAAPNRLKEISANIGYYIEQLKDSFNQDNGSSFIYNFRYHVCALFRILELEMAYVVENYVDKSNYPRLYPEVNPINHHEISKRGEDAPCKVSVVLLAYNNLDYTRDCVESILSHTKDVDYELILVDNGSTDGTKEYFDSIVGAKVIHLKYNLHIVKGFNIGMMAAEGKYCAVLCNDFIFTPNWLNNLMICIESDPEIGYVSPGATSISNMQQITLSFKTMEEFQDKARAYNVSDSTKWEERVVLLPNVLCCPTALLEAVGYYDTRFFRGEFADDDISFKIRRAGYKLVYCSDTVTYHYGSLTTISDHQTHSLEEGRLTFREKYGFDAWSDARMNSDYLELDFNLFQHVKTILGIDVKCGATLLQFKNNIWKNHGVKPALLIGAISEQQYLKDQESIADQVYPEVGFEELHLKLDQKMDLVYIERSLDNYSEDLSSIFNHLSKAVQENGVVIFKITNSASLEFLYNSIYSSDKIHNQRIYTKEMICLQAHAYRFEVTSIFNFGARLSDEDQRLIEDVAHSLAGGEEKEKSNIASVLKTSHQMYQMKRV
ncbi:glycosyltransferase [Paenibacillus pasadenensis]|uniref:glycosyltransferase family 2 protein n=1 Tax=Paenibacillus pasadenensis TaxID=217090 RepID=UPI00203EFC25|nr:glycosyltransferase [Paenibacillus pasadenensis]MCM3750207.1 glycosyltransferase [Paenibacillus pasadenensis]